jgi:mannose-6-phosphate isomerase-like protein (cupin superfamily)
VGERRTRPPAHRRIQARRAALLPDTQRIPLPVVHARPAAATVVDNVDVEAALAEFDQRLPGLADVQEAGNPGMHTTDSVDFDFVVSGEVFLELDDGAEVLLRPGDSVVQNGTRHRWNNRSDQPCTIVVAIVGAPRK